MRDDEHYMARALELAARPLRTAPNPRVGAVLVRDGEVIAEGYHSGAGSPHAEVVAIEGHDVAGATLFVNLEPCLHQGRTPPCAPLIVESGIARVVIAMQDPDERVRGRGVDFLRARDVAVTDGVLADDANRLNRAYVHHRSTGRPFVTLKLALSIDARLGARDRSARWITGEEARKRAHYRRAEVDAVLVGVGTVLADDPQLTSRDAGATLQPVRVVVDARGRLPRAARVFGPGEVIVATSNTAPHEQQVAWKEAGAEVLVLPGDERGVDLPALIADLGRRGMTEVFCEGGGELATSLLRAGLVDRLEVHQGGVLLGAGGPEIGDLGIESMAETPRWKRVAVESVGDDVIVVWERD